MMVQGKIFLWTLERILSFLEEERRKDFINLYSLNYRLTIWTMIRIFVFEWLVKCNMEFGNPEIKWFVMDKRYYLQLGKKRNKILWEKWMIYIYQRSAKINVLIWVQTTHCKNETKKLIKSENKTRYIYLYILSRLLIRVPAFVEAFIWKPYKTRCEKVHKILINVQLEFYIETIEDIHRSLINIYHAHPWFIYTQMIRFTRLRIYRLLKFLSIRC